MKTMKFTSLRITEGDSFLLECNNKKILVDTRKSPIECPEQLNAKNITCLDLIVITHYDLDHVNGLINLMKSGIKITEVWLPDNFGRITKSLKENKSRILNKLKKIEDLSKKETETNIEQKEIKESDPVIETIVEFYLDFKDNHRLIYLELNSPLFLKENQLTIIESIVDECHINNIPIKWLKYTGFYEEKRLSLNLIGLNCIFNNNITAYSDDLEVMYFLSRINHESLVLKFNKNNFPNVLFTADSGFEFMNSNQIISVNENSIITAPHHGSSNSDNEKGYQYIKGINKYYVRSENYKVSSISNIFKNHSNSYCTRCRNNGVFNQVEMQLLVNEWSVSGTKCSNSCLSCN